METRSLSLGHAGEQLQGLRLAASMTVAEVAERSVVDVDWLRRLLLQPAGKEHTRWAADSLSQVAGSSTPVPMGAWRRTATT